MWSSVLIISLAINTALATVIQTPQVSGYCYADNCLRAVRASANIARGSLDCSKFQIRTTIATTLPTPTVTVTIYALYETPKQIPPRHPNSTPAVTPTPTPIGNVPGVIPVYASKCSGSIRYSSACSCIGITSTVVVATTITPIAITHTSTLPACNPSSNYGQVYGSGAYEPPIGTTDKWSYFDSTRADCCIACFTTPGCMLFQYFGQAWGKCSLLAYSGGGVTTPGNAICKAGFAKWDFVVGNALAKGPCVL